MTLEEIYGNAKALVEDKTYQIGEISEKTGLQKTANGWVKPKGSNAGKHQKAMENAKKVGIVKEVPAGWKKAEGVTTTPNGYVAITNGGARFPKEGQTKREVKFIKQEDFEKRNGKNTTEKDVNIEKLKTKRTELDNQINKIGEEKKTSSKSLKLPDEKSSFQTDVNRMKKLKKEDYKQYTIQLEKLHSKYPINKWKDLYNKTANDSACRITADTKIKLKNVVENKVKENA